MLLFLRKIIKQLSHLTPYLKGIFPHLDEQTFPIDKIGQTPDLKV